MGGFRGLFEEIYRDDETHIILWWEGEVNEEERAMIEGLNEV